MGCGTCPKKQLKLKSDPSGISRTQLEEIRGYLSHRIAIKDRTGITTRGTCIDVWVDEDENSETVTLGNIAVETNIGLNMIGLDMIETIQLDLQS